MIRLFDICIYIFNWGYAFLFFWILRTFLPLRRPLILKIAAFPFCSQIALMIIYSNDPVGSSQSKRAGFFARALAIATRCCSPPDS